MKEGYQKAFKMLSLFFLSNPVPFTGQGYEKQKGALGTSDQLLFRLQNMLRKVSLLVIYYLIKFDDVIQSGFWVIPWVTSGNLCKPIHDIIYSTFISPFESGKCEKEGKKLQKFDYLENKKSSLHEMRSIFHGFWRAIIWWKKKE